MHNITHPAILVTPLRQGVSAAGGTLEALVRVQAPDQPAATGAIAPRDPLRLALVIDRSGSMSGRPLAEALRCAVYIASHLQRQDQVAVVLYDDVVQVPVPLTSAGDPDAIRLALAGVDSGGCTALYDGWLAGAQQLEGAVAGTHSRVLLLSDGQANRGLQELAEVAPQVAAWERRGITTTTVGLGNGFNEGLMVGMARAGRGQSYYGQAAEDLQASFDEELALLQATCLKSLQLKLTAAEGVIVEAMGLGNRLPDGSIGLPDLAWGSEAWILVRLHVAPVAHIPDPRVPRALLAVGLQAVDMAGGRPVAAHGLLALPVLPATDAQGLPADELVARRIKEVAFSDAAEKVRGLLHGGQPAEARQLLHQLRQQFHDQPWLAGKIEALLALIERDVAMASKEALYSSAKAAMRLAPRHERSFSAAEEDDLPLFLRRRTEEGTSGRQR